MRPTRLFRARCLTSTAYPALAIADRYVEAERVEREKQERYVSYDIIPGEPVTVGP